MESLRQYKARSSYCNDALSSLYDQLKHHPVHVTDSTEALSLVCEALRRHRLNLENQIAGRYRDVVVVC